MMKISSVLLLAAASALSPMGAQAHAQSSPGPFIGVGAGASRVAEPDVNAARLAPSVNLRAGWRISPTVSVMLEGSLNGIGSPNRADSIIDPDINGGTYRNRQLTTGAVLASVQVGTPALYVRPGVGISRHAFTAYYPLPADGYAPETSYESGPAAGIAVGRRVGFIPGFPLQVEAVGVWTGGEDSSGSRWSAGVQFAREFHF